MKFYKLLAVAMVAQYSFAGSQYPGKYLCNDAQLVDITSNVLKMSNAVFKHYVLVKKDKTDVYIIDDQIALFSVNRSYKTKDRYSLTIRTIKSFKKDTGFEFVGTPYVGDCVAVK